jgi:hypothetical protein
MTKPRFMVRPVPADVAPEVGMVFVLQYREDYMQCDAITITEVDGDKVGYVEHISGRQWEGISWRRRFQRLGLGSYVDDVEMVR